MKDEFHELIHQARLKNKKSEDTTNLRNHLNQSYQQYEFLNMKNSFERLIQNLEFIGKHGKVNTKCFSKIPQSPHKFSSSLMSLCMNIGQLLQEQSKVRISHQHHSSQIIFLGLFLKFTQPQKYISILTTKASFKNWEQYLIQDKSTDPQSDLKALLKEVNITVHFINESYKNAVTHSNQILIFDLMNSEVIDYKPLLIAQKQTLQVPQKIIIYHSHDQQIEVQNVLGSLNIPFFLSQASLTYPIQIQYVQKDAQIKSKLIEFLKQDSTHPQKQDIIVFYKNQHLSNSSAKRFSSKLKQALSDKNILSQVQLITSKSQILIEGKNHIFISQNVSQLIDWNYSYADVFYVIDYGWDTFYRMDHENNCYVEGLNKSDLKEKTRRLSFIGINKVGKYVYREDDCSEIKEHLDRAQQLMTYTLRMVELGLTEFLEVQHTRVKTCLKNLLKNHIIKKDQSDNGKLKIVDQDILKCNQNGLDPIHAKIVRLSLEKQKDKQQKVLTNLILMSLCILNTRGSLRQSKDTIGSKSVVKPSGIWRRTGYLDSCLEIITKAEIVQTGKNASRSISRRKISKMNETEFEVYGGLFDVISPKKMEFEEMQMDDLVREYFVSDNVFAQLRSKLDELRQIFQIQQTNIKLNPQLLGQVVQILTSNLSNTSAIFSGSRRLGYFYKNQTQKKSIFPSRQSLIAQLNETPQFLFVLRCTQQQGKRQILMSNAILFQSFMSVYGQLPCKKSDSLAEHQLQFHGISSSIFKGLFRDNGIQMQKFEQEHKCFVEPNEQMATITIYCSKQQSQKIKTVFQELVTKIKEKFINYNKIVHYLGNTNISMSNGGEVKQIIKDNYINSCVLNNLDLEVTQEDLEQLFDQFFVLKSIEIFPPQTNKFYKHAVIQFNSQKDYYRFFSYYHQCKYFDRILDVKPIKIKKSNSIKQQMYINFKWYVWKSHRKAIVVFKNTQGSQKAWESLKQYPNVDQTPVTFVVDKTKVTLDNLNPAVDQIFLKTCFEGFGQIQEVEILKTPLKQPSNQESLLDCLIRDTLNIQINAQIADKYKINEIEKHKSGLRTCKVTIFKIDHLNTLISNLHGLKSKLGQSRLYAYSVFTRPFIITHPSASPLYQELLQETISQAQPKPKMQSYIKDYGNGRLYLILTFFMAGTKDHISSEFEKRLQPNSVDLSQMQKNIILSDVGINNLIDLQEKFNCKLVVNSMKKTLEVICKFDDLKKIRQEITARVEDKFFYRISLNTKSYKNLSNDKPKLEEIKSKFHLTVLEIEEYSKTLIFEGSANHVQNALNTMMFVIESYSKSQEELINTEVCLICYQDLFRPYRLQNCGHKFCFGCLDQCINSALGDISMFPIKCPHCMVELTIDDLDSLLDSGAWPKLINMAANQYVNRNADVMTFCYTPGCKQINLLQLTNFKCDQCNASFCCQCKQHYHAGLTCQQAKQGGDTLFKKYMLENDVRICPNKNCKMPIQRTDGCFRVTCSRCNKSMCFKCERDKMIAYDDYNLCYAHLNEVHGGYW